MLSCEFCKISKNTSLTEHLRLLLLCWTRIILDSFLQSKLITQQLPKHDSEKNNVVKLKYDSRVKTVFVLYFLRLPDTSQIVAFSTSGRNIVSLTHISSVFHIYIPWKHQKTKDFLPFSRGIEIKHWVKMG